MFLDTIDDEFLGRRLFSLELLSTGFIARFHISASEILRIDILVESFYDTFSVTENVLLGRKELKAEMYTYKGNLTDAEEFLEWALEKAVGHITIFQFSGKVLNAAFKEMGRQRKEYSAKIPL